MSIRTDEIKRQTTALAIETAKKIGASAWYDHLREVLTEEELAQVKQKWDAMPGNTCWMDASLKWFNEQATATP